MKFLGALFGLLKNLFGLLKNIVTIGFTTVCALLLLAVVMPDNFIQAVEYIKCLF